MIFFISCKTSTVEKTIYYIPEVDWPEFPELGEYQKIENGKLTTDEDYFRKLLIFRTMYLDEQSKYEEKRKLLEEIQK